MILARIATETLYGKLVVEMDVVCQEQPETQTILIETLTEAGRTLAILFHGYALAEFGAGAFQTRRLTVGEAS